MIKTATEISLTRKLRLLMGMPEVVLSAEEAELYRYGADVFAPEEYFTEEGEPYDE